MGGKNVFQTCKAKQDLPSEDIAYRKIRDIMESDVSRMRTSVEIQTMQRRRWIFTP